MKPVITHIALYRFLSNSLLLVWSLLLLFSVTGLVSYQQAVSKAALEVPTTDGSDAADDESQQPIQSIQAPVQAAISPIGQLPVFHPAAFAPTEIPEAEREEALAFTIPPLYGKLARILFRTLISPNAP